MSRPGPLRFIGIEKAAFSVAKFLVIWEVAKHGGDSHASCKLCAVSLFNDQTARDAAADCKNCAVGLYNDQTGQDAAADCKVCAVGLYNDQLARPAAVWCKGCAVGLYNEPSGQRICF
eukprot:g6316.t1